MKSNNETYDLHDINSIKKALEKSGKNFIINKNEENGSDMTHFLFIGMYEGKEVIYDAAIYTLRLHYESELYEVAEHKAAQKFPEFRKIQYEEDENGDFKLLDDLEEEIGLYIAQTILELEDDDEYKVQEFIEIDPNLDYGVGIDVALNVDEITDKVIEKFVNEYNEDNLNLDPTLYSFETADQE